MCFRIKFAILIFFLTWNISVFSEVQNNSVDFSFFDDMPITEFNQKYQPEFKTFEDNHRKPIVKIAPHYPMKAAERGITGSVLVGYEVLPDGSVGNIDILEEPPKKYRLGEAARKAAEQFKYQPTSDHDAAAEPNIMYALNRFTFSLEPRVGSKRDWQRLLNQAQAGDAKSLYDMVALAPTKYGVKLSAEKVDQLILEAAIRGEDRAQLVLGIRLFSGLEMKKDRSKSEAWLKLAATNGNVFAQKFLKRNSSYFSETSDQISDVQD